jgi:hypothetical protein
VILRTNQAHVTAVSTRGSKGEGSGLIESKVNFKDNEANQGIDTLCQKLEHCCCIAFMQDSVLSCTVVTLAGLDSRLWDGECCAKICLSGMLQQWCFSYNYSLLSHGLVSLRLDPTLTLMHAWLGQQLHRSSKGTQGSS